MIFADILTKINSPKGNEILILERKPDEYEKTVLVIGVFHGDEPDGEYLINRFLSEKAGADENSDTFENHVSNRQCSFNNQKNRVLFVPCLNPDGKVENKRTNSNGVDLNRNFPAKNWAASSKDDVEKSGFFGGEKPASEVETQFLVYVIERYKPDLIVTLHEPYRVVNYDGPAKEIAQKISEITGYEVEENIGYPTPGSFGTYCGVERNIPTITLELPQNESKEVLWNDNKGLFDYVTSSF